MEIIKRHKNLVGDTVGYTVSNNGQQYYRSKQDIINIAWAIDNAELLSNNEFRAKKGCHIDTVMDTGSLSVQHTKNLSNEIKSKEIEPEYYGKEFINICRKIRKYAADGKIIVSTDKHTSNEGRNIHLFKLIEACGLSIEDFVRGYLSVIQPYALEKFKGNSKSSKLNNDKDYICMCDTSYNKSESCK